MPMYFKNWAEAVTTTLLFLAGVAIAIPEMTGFDANSILHWERYYVVLLGMLMSIVSAWFLGIRGGAFMEREAQKKKNVKK